MYQIIDKLDSSQVKQLSNLYNQCWWIEDRDIEGINIMLKNSNIIGIIDSEAKLIGFARFLTDEIYKAIIFDVVCDEKHRGDGIGAIIMNSLLTHPKLRDVKNIELYCKNEMIPFYEKWYFTEVSNINFMRKIKFT